MRLSIRWKLIIAIAGPLLIISTAVIGITIYWLRVEATTRLRADVEGVTASIAGEFNGAFDLVAQVARDTAAQLEITPELTDRQLYAMVEANVRQNPLIYGSCIAFTPPFAGEGRRLFAPYAFREAGAVAHLDIGRDSYDYTSGEWEWYSDPARTLEPVWTAPYFDEGAGDILMCTYSVPFFAPDGALRGIATIDVPVAEIQSRTGMMRLGGRTHMIVDDDGRFISHPDPENVMDETIFAMAEREGSSELRELATMLSRGGAGSRRVSDIGMGEPVVVFHAPIRSTGWTFLSAVSERELLSFSTEQFARAMMATVVLEVLIIGCVVLVGTHLTRPVTKLAAAVRRVGRGDFEARVGDVRSKDEIGDLAQAFDRMVHQVRDHMAALEMETAARQAVESELRVARDIQTSLLPHTFPPFPSRDEFELHASNAAARHVAGDFYDFFFISEHELIVVIADVSGKGVPAAMLMAVCRTVVRNFAQEGLSPAAILHRMNALLSQDNPEAMFVTIFLARYHTDTGELLYANAAHPYPLRRKTDGSVARFGIINGGLVGVFPDAMFADMLDRLEPGETLLLYTDGVTEAHDPSQRTRSDFFGEERLQQVVARQGMDDPAALCDAVVEAVDEHQHHRRADDVTVLALKRTR